MQAPLPLCEATKLDSKQCTRTSVTQNASTGKHLCTQHAKKAGTTIKEPWQELGLIAPSEKIGQKALGKLRRRLRNTKKDRGGSGSIYVYYIATEAGLDYWKVGMTKKDADERLNEWQKTHKARVLKKCEFKVDQSVLFIERIVHLYLDHCRMHRTPTADGKETLFRSVYSATGELIDDDQDKKIGTDERLVAKNKHVEWFNAPITEVKSVIESIVNAFGK